MTPNAEIRKEWDAKTEGEGHPDILIEALINITRQRTIQDCYDLLARVETLEKAVALLKDMLPADEAPQMMEMVTVSPPPSIPYGNL